LCKQKGLQLRNLKRILLEDLKIIIGRLEGNIIRLKDKYWKT